ncbi:hypothetical protein WJX81_000718 [Elliptochloris bilobata]|uniref:Uncharacterized protein n=1 Tax=Elliptochloris bilobata TaxID=381761 RepID=A0AAW1S146_9CHLO
MDEFNRVDAASVAPPDLRVLPNGKLTVLGTSGQRYMVLPSRERRDLLFLESREGVQYILSIKAPANINDMSLMQRVFANPGWEKAMRPYKRPKRGS